MMVRVAQGVFLGRECGREATERKECNRQLNKGGREGRGGVPGWGMCFACSRNSNRSGEAGVGH